MPRIVSDRADAVLALASTFRNHGYEGATLSIIAAETGLGKGSLYHYFPGGKEDMANAVLEEVQRWFRVHIFAPLAQPGDPELQIASMLTAAADYFESRHMVCLFGAFALGQERERFAEKIRVFFGEWITALAAALERAGHTGVDARAQATDAVCAVQGALVVGRALDDQTLVRDALERCRIRMVRCAK